MHKTPRTIAFRAAPLALLALLAACSSKPETVTGAGPDDPDANAVASAAPVTLPPALLASRTFRCDDNSLIYVDFFADNVTADLKTDKGGPVTKLTAPAAGEAYVADGYSVAANAATTSITVPGKGAQSCKA